MPIFTDGPRLAPIEGPEAQGISLGEMLGETARAAVSEFPTVRALDIRALNQASSTEEDLGLQIARIQGGEDLADVVGKPKAPTDLVSMAAARAQLKEHGVDKGLTLPNQPEIRQAALDIMIERAKERREREATIARGPGGVVPSALAVGTSFLVGAVDPLNLASAFIPVVGELRYAKLLADAGESVAARAGVRAGVGAAEGAVGQAVLEPIQATATLQEGQDYTMAHALRSVIFGAALGAGLRTGGGAIADVARMRGERPLYPYDVGEPLEYHTPFSDVALPRPRPLMPSEGMPNLPERYPGLEPTRGEGAAPSSPSNEGAKSVVTPADPHQAVFDDALTQLRAAGMNEDEAAQNAAVVAARYAARAERLGRGDNTFDLYHGEGLAVSQAGDHAPIDGLTLDQARRRSGERDLFAEREAEGQQNLPGTERIGQGELAQRKADEPLKPKAEQKPMDVGLFGDDAKQKSFFQSQPAPPFYSAVSRAIDTAKLEKAPPAQWLGTLKNTPGVKPEEMQWLGLEDWLKGHDGPVNKQAIADYVRANQIEVKEVTKAAPNVENAARGYDLHPKYSQWQLPGGENYRELLLTLPETGAGKPRATAQELAELAGEDWSTLGPNGRQRFQDQAADQGTTGDFKSAHWDEPNVLAHVRFNDRTIDGKRALFLEEIQSDWHQAGKRRGYAGAESPEERALAQERDKLATEAAALQEKGPRYGWRAEELENGRWVAADAESLTILDDAALAEAFPTFDTRARAELEAGIGRDDGGQHYMTNPEWIRRMDRITEINQQIGRPHDVPDAPFKTTWPELALKRMIRYAAENGYDKIAWTDGATQAARYDLSKHIKVVRFDKFGDSGFTRHEHIEDRTTGQLTAFDHDGKEVLRKHIESSELGDYIGKDAADKLLAQEGQYGSFAGTAMVRRKLEGLDLKVGGEGMAGFYDKMLPAAANKLTKKFGAKAERASLKHLDDTDRDVPFIVLDREGRVVETDISDENYAAERARDVGGSYEFDRTAGETREAPVHTLDITPALREAAVGEGFPLFQRGGEGESRGRITLSDNRAVVELFKNADQSTFMHEMGHKWLEELAHDAAGANVPQALKDDLGTVLRWLGVDKAEDIGVPQHEQWARGFEQYLREGSAPSSALARAFEAFKNWLTGIYKNLTELGTPITDDIRGVMDRMLATDRELAERKPTPAMEILADLPPRAKEDAMRAATAALVSGEPVRVGEMVEAAAKVDPRIAESLAAGDFDPVVHVRAKPRRGPAARDPDTFSLLEFIASNGGIRSDDPLISDLRSIFGRNNRPVPGFGSLIREPRELSTAAWRGGARRPLFLDQMREAAVEAGYIFDIGHITGAQRESTVSTLLELVEREVRGNRVYKHDRVREPSKADLAEWADEEKRHYEDKAFDGLTEQGFDPATIPPKTFNRVLEIMRREGESDALAAYERAVMEETYYGAEAGQHQRIPDRIPGWDAVPDEPGAAPAPGRAAAAVGEPGPGGPARPAGGGDRAALERDAWRDLSRPVAEDGEALAASRAADKLPEPPSTVPDKRLQAAEQAAADAERAYLDAEAYLPEDLRKRVAEDIDQFDQDVAARAEVTRRGGACLAAAVD